jgi:hypothetical protein
MSEPVIAGMIVAGYVFILGACAWFSGAWEKILG